MIRLLANYEAEQDQFAQLLQPDSRRRILMFKGESGIGKTRLLDTCMDKVPAHIRYLSIQLRGSTTNAGSIFYRLGRRAGWERVPTFTHQIADLAGAPEAYSDRNWQIGMRQHLQAALQVEDVAIRSQRRAALTDAWFADVQTFDAPFLLVMDTYEQATSELDQWFNRQFLPWIADTREMRVLVAGQALPELSTDWRHCCQHYELRGVTEAKAWLPVVEAMGRQTPSLDYLAGACAMANGNSSKILEFIQLLPMAATGAPQDDPAVSTRAQLRQKMADHFDELDLRELCFDFNIDYESLGDSKSPRAKVMALIVYMDNRGRTQELVARCRELRPHLDW